MTMFGLCRADADAVPSVDAWKLARTIGFTLGRVTPGLQNVFPASGRDDFATLDEIIGNVRKAESLVYLNPCNFPAQASGGTAVYVAAVTGSSCWALKTFGAPRDLWAAIYELAAARDDDAIDTLASAVTAAFPVVSTNAAWHFAKHYIDERAGAWAWNDPENAGGGVHAWGDPAFSEQDKLSAPRPLVRNPPPIDPDFVFMAGRVLAERYGAQVDLWGMPLNEPDIALFYPALVHDWHDGVDIVRDWIYPQIVRPWVAGVRRGLGSRVPRFVGVEVATAGMMQRCIDADAARDAALLSGHWYAWGGEGWPKDSYRRIREEYLPVVRKDGRPFICGEVDGPEVSSGGNGGNSIVDWTRDVLAMDVGASAIIFNVAERFIDSFASAKPQINRTGREISRVMKPPKRRAAKH